MVARENGGFDAVVGNPPFAGKNTIIASNGDGYIDWLKTLHEGAHGNADIVAHFFRRAFELLRKNGTFGLIATNTIGQGDTRATGLTAILVVGGSIRRAVKRLKWPGEAAVVVSVVHVTKGPVHSPLINGRQVSRISAYLVEGEIDDTPTYLAANDRRAFQGSILLGMGFTFDDLAAARGEAESLATMHALIDKAPRNAKLILPYIGGEEVNNSPTHAHYRYAIDFFDRPLRRDDELKPWAEMDDDERAGCRVTGNMPADYPGDVAEDWPDLIEIVRRRVKPERDRQKRKARRIRWWQYAEKSTGLYQSIEHLASVFVNSSKATPHHSVALLPNGMVYSQNLNVFAFDSLTVFCILSCRAHEVWARFVGTTFEDRMTYVKEDCFETFPFPAGVEVTSVTESAGRAYHDHRAALMVVRNEGMTKTYNRFHDPTETSDDIQHVRELHAAMDRAVLEAYGWHDLAARAEPRFLDETSEDDHTYQGRLFWPSDFRDEVLARLLALNADRHAEEVRLGIAPGMKGKCGVDDEDDED